MEASASASSSTVRNMIGLPYPEWMGSIVLVLFYCQAGLSGRGGTGLFPSLVAGFENESGWF
jgi:hypothetical protein